ncbi:MAG: Gram-negative type outer rane porin protein [Burkholderiaceae bacterium]|nr:Gram-negative type outer rane porin protein [Burkholderiaceae bacterium]
MKQSLVALAILGTFAGVASAASSVTLYGAVELGYTDLFGKGEFANGATPNTTGLNFPQNAVKTGTLKKAQGILAKSLAQTPRRSDRFGIMGEEDLGNGVSAIFKLEANLKADNGDTTTGQLFNRESTVGLKGNFGEVKIGRAKSQVELATGGLIGTHGVADVDLYSISNARHSNGLFYEYKNSGFTVGADVTTKGGALGNTNEGATGSKVGYGARLGYYGHGLLARLAYQNDGPVEASSTVAGNALAIGKKQHEWAAVLAYNFYEGKKIPLAIGVSYAQGKGMAKGFFSATGLDAANTDTVYAKKASTLGAIVRTWFSPNDTAYVLYQKRKSTAESGATMNNAWAIALGYEHKLSKRTAISLDTVYLKAKNIGVASPFGFVGVPVSAKAYGYSVGLSHSF